jgi:hypothetical protein
MQSRPIQNDRLDDQLECRLDAFGPGRHQARSNSFGRALSVRFFDAWVLIWLVRQSVSLEFFRLA